MPRTHTLRNIIHKGSCLRKGGDVELVATINAGRKPDSKFIDLMYDSVLQSKAYEWASKPFKGSRLVLRYIGGEKDGHYFMLDGKFSEFLKSEATKTPPKSTPYEDDMDILVGQVWSLDGADGPYKILIRSEARHDSVFLSFSAEISGEPGWVASDHSTKVSGVRQSLAANNGRLVGAVL